MDSEVHEVIQGSRNKLLAALPRDDFELLQRHLTTQIFEQGEVFYEPEQEVDQVYFPLSGMISLVVVMKNGKAIETATVGREGVVGAMSGLGLYVSDVRAVVQLQLVASQIASADLRKAAGARNSIAAMCIGYNEVLLTQARVTAGCNAVHSVEAEILPMALADP